MGIFFSSSSSLSMLSGLCVHTYIDVYIKRYVFKVYHERCQPLKCLSFLFSYDMITLLSTKLYLFLFNDDQQRSGIKMNDK